MSDDELGDIYRHDIRAQGVAFDTRPLDGNPPTARSMILVTPDGERSMNTYLGACVELGPEDVEADKAAAAKVTYFEGYLWDPPRAKQAIRLTAGHAHAAGREVSMTLSDPFCVDRYRDEFLDLMRSGTVDIVFANESELKSLYQTASFETALELIRKDCKLAAVTRSEKRLGDRLGGPRRKWSRRSRSKDWSTRPAPAISTPPASCSATRPGAALPIAARLGSLAAGLVIQQIGPRPRQNLREEAVEGRAAVAARFAVTECPRAVGLAGSCRTERSSRSEWRRRGWQRQPGIRRLPKPGARRRPDRKA